MNDRIVLLRPNPNVLVVRHSVVGAVLAVVYHLGFFALWYSFLLYAGSLRDQLSENWMLWIFVLAPLLSLPTLFQLLRTCLMGRVYEFDTMTRTVRRNGNDMARFDNIQRVQLRTIHDSDSADEYRLSLVLNDGSKIPLAHTQNEERVAQAADDIADLLKVDVVRK